MYESAQLSGVEKNYHIHKKELLAIIWALKKWRSDLLGSTIYVYTDHKTLLNLDGQKNLSWRQLQWQEYMSQYELYMHYIQCKDNMVADALSQLPPESIGAVCTLVPHVVWVSGVNVTMSLSTDGSVLQAIKDGYKSDPFCDQLSKTSTPGTTSINNLWCIGNCLLIPRVGELQENLFHLAHDTLGHFGADKAYAVLHNSYYWPNMRCDLEKSYILSCEECQ